MSTTNLPLVYGVLLYEGMSILDIYTLVEFLNIISLDIPLKIYLISTEPSNVVSTKVGQSYIAKIKPAFLGGEQRMVADFSLDNAPDVDVIVVPGGTASDEVISNGRLAEFLKARYPTLKHLVGICTGGAIIAASGLLDNKRAAGTKVFWSWVSAQGTNVSWIPKARFMNDGNIWTSSGLTAGLDLSYAFIKEVYGTEVAEKAAMVMEYIPSEDPLTDPFAAKYGLA